MSISSFCIKQREKEKEALKTFLAYGIAGSAVFHLVLGFSIALLWPKEPSYADDPIEIIVVDSPEPEVDKPKEKAEVKPPTPKPQQVVTPPPEPPKPIPTPEPIQPQKLVTAAPTTVTEPFKPAVPLSEPVSQQLSQPVEPPKPAVPLSEPVSQQPAPIPPQPTSVAATNPPPQQPASVSEPLPPPPEVPREFRQRLTDSVSSPAPSENNPPPPEPVAANNPPPPQAPATASQPLQAPSESPRSFRDLLTGSTPADVSDLETSNATPTIPGGVAPNQQPPSDRSTPVSQPLQTSASENRSFRESFASTSNSSLGANPADDASLSTPGMPGGVSANRQAPPNPAGVSQPLQTSGAGNREFRDSFASANNSPFGSNSGSEFSPTTPTTASGVAANRGVPPRPSSNAGGGSRNGNRRGSGGGGLRCIRQCNPEYPAWLEVVEGRPVIRFVVESDGSTSEPLIAQSSGNEDLDRAAVEAVQQMKFASPDGGRRTTVRLAINFAERGSDFERQARQREEENQRQRRERERQRQEQERQAQLDQERQERERQQQQEQERQAQLERERQEQLERERQEQLERERQEQLERERQEQQETDFNSEPVQ